MLNEHSSGHTLTYQRHAFAHATHSAGSPYFACCDRTQTTKRFIKASKRDACVISPQKSFGLGIWIRISWVICYELSLAIRINLQRAVFSSFLSRGRWRLMCVFESYGRTTTAGNWPHIPNPQLKLHPSLSLFLSPPFIPPCCLPSTPLCSLFAASLACQMVFEWILKSRLHWTSIIFLCFFF